MDGNNTVILDTCNLSIDELQEEYGKLSKFYAEVKKTNEHCMQEIYELKRSLNTVNAAERFLTQELEALQLSHRDELNVVNEKFRVQLHDTKQRNHELSNLNAQLESKVEELEVKIEKLEQELLERNDVSVEMGSATLLDSQKELELEKKNFELTEMCGEMGKRIGECESLIYELKLEKDCLKERLECAEDNFYSKKEEVQEKNTVIDGLHEKMIELTAELNEIKNSPPERSKKGNSLFAEVDDQRQLMKNILANQKKQYLQMQKQFSEREYEIRRLKQENSAIHKEMEICSSIFLKADTNYRHELQKRIKGLFDEKKQLEDKLKISEKLLSDMSNNKGMNWMDTIMAHCKNETDDMKKKYHNCLLEKSFLDENYLKSQQSLAKWRFEALKSRCIIIDRETKLQEHKIPFDDVKFAPHESDIQKCEPIVSFSETPLKKAILPEIENKANVETQSGQGINVNSDETLDLSDDHDRLCVSLSPKRFSPKMEQMDTTNDDISLCCTSITTTSESQITSSCLSPPPPPPPCIDSKNFSIFCDSIIGDVTLQESDFNSNPLVNSTIKIENVEMDTSPVPNKVIEEAANIKTEIEIKPIKLEKPDEITSTRKKNNLIIRKVFIKSKK